MLLFSLVNSRVIGYNQLMKPKGDFLMPAIKPISDLRNYTQVLKEVDSVSRVYLTRNGQGAYAIMSIEELDELDRIKAASMIVSDLRRAKARADREGWISDDEMQEIMEN